jgi:hypothetical protein
MNKYRNPHRAPFSNSRQWRLVLRRKGSSVSRGSRQMSHSVVPHRSPGAQIPKGRERDRFSCQVLGYGCHPHRGMTTAPQCTYSYLTEAITRCHQGHTHPTGSGILVYDSITSFIIQDSGVNARKILFGRTSSAILCLHTSATSVCLSCCAAGRNSYGRVNSRLYCANTLQLRASAVPNLRSWKRTTDAMWCRNLLTGLSPLPRQS